MIHVDIASPQETVPIDRPKMRDAVRRVLQEEEVGNARISLAFVDNPTIQQLNQRYLEHNEPTDVLSFPLSEGSLSPLQGELVIGAEVAKEQAAARGHDVQIELILYVIHGLLHLCGHDDSEPSARAEMRKREKHYLAALGLPDIAPSDDD